MTKLSLRPVLTMLSAAAVALAIATSAVAQTPPSTPHQFFGSGADRQRRAARRGAGAGRRRGHRLE